MKSQAFRLGFLALGRIAVPWEGETGGPVEAARCRGPGQLPLAFDRSFRRRMLASGLLKATGERETAVEHRPAELYRFTKRSAI